MGGEDTPKHSDFASQKPQCVKWTSKSMIVWLISFIYVMTYTVVPIDLPIFTGSMEMAGGDSFSLLLYISLCFPVVFAAMVLLYKALWDRSVTLLPVATWRITAFVGVMFGLAGVGLLFAGPPERTPPYLVGILVTLRVPFTVLLRFIILRRGLSLRRLGCTVAVIVGVVITLAPQFWSLPGSGNESSAGGSLAAQVMWPILFGIGQLPLAIIAVVCERELKQDESQSLTFIGWATVFNLFTTIALFWVDFLPGFGMASSPDEFIEHQRRGLACQFNLAEDCHGLVYKGWILVLGFCLGNLFQFLLIQRGEGAVLAVVVQSMVTPLATLFWTFFKFDVDQDHIDWDPEFTETTAFTIGGLLIILPGVVLYNVFSRWDAQEDGGKINGHQLPGSRSGEYHNHDKQDYGATNQTGCYEKLP